MFFFFFNNTSLSCCIFVQKNDLKTYFDCVYAYEGKITHQIGESHSKLLSISKRKHVAEKVTNEGKMQRQVAEDSVL